MSGTVERPYSVSITLASRRLALADTVQRADEARAKAAGPITWEAGRAWATPSAAEWAEWAERLDADAASYRAEIAWLAAFPGEWFGPADLDARRTGA